jgi:hypothetical protein
MGNGSSVDVNVKEDKDKVPTTSTSKSIKTPKEKPKKDKSIKEDLVDLKTVFENGLKKGNMNHTLKKIDALIKKYK